MNPVREFQAQRFLPEGRHLLFTVFLNIHNLRRVVNTFSVLEDRNHQLSHGIAARRQVSLFPGLNGIKQQQRAVRIVYFINQTDEISNDLSVFLIVNPADGFISRVGDLFRIF